MVIVDTKLSEKTAFTKGQKLAQQQAGKGKLAYKSKEVKGEDELKIKLPKEIEQGEQIQIKAFYKMYGDGNNQFLGIK
ncbi:peptidase [Capnocytophaga stomatis]|uniref:Peptidase n=2 Tax=Capnocytophaga stomatis TaxID=1848904 RepID=A0A250FZR4_9FLAO|nr:peptidase [Capnocytophaga stomatis]